MTYDLFHFSVLSYGNIDHLITICIMLFVVLSLLNSWPVNIFTVYIIENAIMPRTRTRMALQLHDIVNVPLNFQWLLGKKTDARTL